MQTSGYFRESSHRFYGAVTALVMLTLYEIFVIWGARSDFVVRNAPEAWLRNTLNFIGISHYHISFLMLGAALVAVPLFYDASVKLRGRVIVLMILESIFWGIASGLLIQLIMTELLFMAGTVSGSLIGDLGLAIGAGLFEELFFRVILTTVLIRLLVKTIRTRWLSLFIAILIASFLFSLAHYVGNLADTFEIYSFLFRFLAGIWFTTLYSFRGFAIVCMSHAFYDIFVILL
ncbi:MAG: CPBP family intramembrane metalloprotease [Desulfobacterales bacterium]|nr:CPBP family intramembrane metalloprotease [Desulfobacterales bacterium]